MAAVGLLVVTLGTACTTTPKSSAPDSDAGIDSGGVPLGPPPTLPEDPSVVGPYPVGVTTMRFVDARGKDLVAEVWYPAVVEDGDEPDPYEPTIFSASAFRDVPPDLRGAPYPVISFSHGMAGIRFQSVFLTERLASWGYVVVAPDHPRNTFLDINPSATPQVVVERPDDIRYSVDELASRASGGDPFLDGLVDGVDEYIAMGHSFGALTTLFLGGGTVDLDAVKAYCHDHSSIACDYVDELDSSMLGNNGMTDDRITAIVPYAPGVWYAFGEHGEGLADTVEPFVFLADQDTVLRYPTEGLPTYEALGAPKRAAIFHNAGHYAFSDICALAAALFGECTETGWIDIDIAHARTNTLTMAWLQARVRGDTQMEAFLTPEHWELDPDITLMEGDPQ